MTAPAPFTLVIVDPQGRLCSTATLDLDADGAFRCIDFVVEPNTDTDPDPDPEGNQP